MNRYPQKFFPVILLFALMPLAQAREPEIYKGDLRSPVLQLRDLDGKQRQLADFKGQVLLVNFWATWCPPCREEMPSIWRLQNGLRGKPFRVIAVNMAETRAEVNAFMPDRMKRDFIVLMDQEGDALKNWKVSAFPTSFIVDKRGRIRYDLVGATEWDDFDTRKLVERLVEE